MSEGPAAPLAGAGEIHRRTAPKCLATGCRRRAPLRLALLGASSSSVMSAEEFGGAPMPFRKNSRLLALIFVLAGAGFVQSAAADMVQQVPPNILQRLRGSGPAPETVWVGHVNTSTGAPGVPGGYGPYHVGRGPNHIVGGGKLGSAADLNGVWDFDH